MANPIEQHVSAAECGLTLERYIETMMPHYGNNTLLRSTRQGHHTMEREDLVQEAAYALTEVWNKYAHLKPEGELRRMGTRAIYFHVGNLYHHLRAFGAADVTMVYPEQRLAEDRGACPIERHQVKHDGRVEPQLESLIARENIETLAMPDFRGPSADAVRKIFSDVARAVRDDDGYSLVEAARKLNYNQRGGIKMNGGAVGPESPYDEQDVTLETLEEVAEPEVKKAKKNAVPTKVAKAARVSVDAAAARVATFKPGQRVKYKGGGRAPNLKAGEVMTVLGSVKSKGRMYLRLSVGPAGSKRLVGMSAALVSKI
jgi:hypothetical protein